MFIFNLTNYKITGSNDKNKKKINSSILYLCLYFLVDCLWFWLDFVLIRLLENIISKNSFDTYRYRNRKFMAFI